MNILVSNDDGIDSKGIYSLASSLSKVGDVTVVAPFTEKSATGHAITFKPMKLKDVSMEGLNIKAYSLDGTPADCIKFGVEHLMDKKPDVIFSGINNGSNLGTDVLYSGTVSAAMEGCMLGYKSVAISLAAYDHFYYDYAAEFSAGIAKIIQNMDIANGSVMNINIPNLKQEEINGVKVAPLGIKKYDVRYEEKTDNENNTYYKLIGKPVESFNEFNTDIEWIKKKFITITPVHYDMTNYSIINEVDKFFKIKGDL